MYFTYPTIGAAPGLPAIVGTGSAGLPILNASMHAWLEW